MSESEDTLMVLQQAQTRLKNSRLGTQEYDSAMRERDRLAIGHAGELIEAFERGEALAGFAEEFVTSLQVRPVARLSGEQRIKREALARALNEWWANTPATIEESEVSI